MRLNTHSPTPSPKVQKPILVLFFVAIGLLYALFLLGAFACFYYAKSVPDGILLLVIPIVMTMVCYTMLNDMRKAYIEVDESTIRVVDYYFGIKKEKLFSFADITSAEIVIGYSSRVKGYRISTGGTQYIVVRKGSEYLFKVICTEDTVNIFKKYLA